MILTGPEIARRVRLGEIEIDPFDPANLNPNSYNLSLGPEMVGFRRGTPVDSKAPPEPSPMAHKDGAWLLLPGDLYLAHTAERTRCDALVPMLEGRSSYARLGLVVHQTGGFGDVGFDGQWTLEITVALPTILYVGQKVCQVAFFEPCGQVAAYAGRYQGQRGATPSRPKKGE